MHCGGQMSRSASRCPWCHRGRGGGVVLEFIFGALAAAGLGTVAALATGVLTTAQVTGAIGGLADRVPSPPPPAITTGSALLQVDDEPAEELDRRSERVRRETARVTRDGCADPATLRGLVERYRDWADGDLALIACGQIRSGFSGAQVVAAIGEPQERLATPDGQEQWRYAGRRVTLRGGQVVATEAD